MKKIVSLCLLLALLALLLVSCGDGTATADFSAGGYSAKSENSSVLANLASGEYESKVIRSASLSAETKEYDKALSHVREQVAALGGYISDSNAWGGGDAGRSVTMTVRVPAEKFDTFLSDAEEAMRITRSTVSTDDVTLSYYDTVSRLDTLRTEKTALDAMLAASTTVQDSLSIEARLYDVIEEIEVCETQKALMDSRIAFSTVILTVHEVVEYTPEEESFGTRIKNAISESWEGFGSFLQGFAVYAVYLVPTILTLTVIGGIAAVIVVLCKKRGKGKSGKSDPSDK